MEQAPEDSGPDTGRRKRPPAWVIWLASFGVSLGVGLVFDHLTNKTILARAVQAQCDWIKAAESTSPVAVAVTYWEELQQAAQGRPLNETRYDFDESRGAGLWSPVAALFSTAARVYETGGLAALLQLALGALAVAVYNHRNSRGRTVFFDELITNLLLGPVAIILAASVIGFALWALMLGAFYALSWVTQVAAALAGSCSVGGFCWYCVRKLGEKQVETALTPKL